MATTPKQGTTGERLEELQGQHPELRERFDEYLASRQAYEAAIGRRTSEVAGRTRRDGVTRTRWT
jgi:lipase chaperone LimK